MKISRCVEEFEQELKEIRRSLHKIPEPSRMEKLTSKFILEYVWKLAPDSVDVLYDTGVKVVFLTPGAKKTIAFRADIDALPVYEKNEDLEYASTHIGFMHACGHDGHTAIMLCLAKLVSKNRDKLKTNIVFIFQPAEETDGGAAPMIDRGVLLNPKVDEIYGLHLWPYLPAGKIGLKTGALMSLMCDLNVNIKGKDAHGARPQNGIDALVAAAQFINQVQSIISRNIDPYDMAVVTLGVISGGEARNIVCDYVHIEGTIRTFDKAVSQTIKERLWAILRGLEEGMGVKTEYNENMSYPAVMNDAGLVEKARGLLEEDDCIAVKEVMMSEDFSFYQEQIPGLFVFLGTKDETYQEPLHSATFNFDEKNLLAGMEFMARVAGLSEENHG